MYIKLLEETSIGKLIQLKQNNLKDLKTEEKQLSGKIINVSKQLQKLKKMRDYYPYILTQLKKVIKEKDKKNRETNIQTSSVHIRKLSELYNSLQKQSELQQKQKILENINKQLLLYYDNFIKQKTYTKSKNLKDIQKLYKNISSSFPDLPHDVKIYLLEWIPGRNVFNKKGLLDILKLKNKLKEENESEILQQLFPNLTSQQEKILAQEKIPLIVWYGSKYNELGKDVTQIFIRAYKQNRQNRIILDNNLFGDVQPGIKKYTWITTPTNVYGPYRQRHQLDLSNININNIENTSYNDTLRLINIAYKHRRYLRYNNKYLQTNLDQVVISIPHGIIIKCNHNILEIGSMRKILLNGNPILNEEQKKIVIELFTKFMKGIYILGSDKKNVISSIIFADKDRKSMLSNKDLLNLNVISRDLNV